MLLNEEYSIEEMAVANRSVAPTCWSIPMALFSGSWLVTTVPVLGAWSRHVASAVLLFLTFLLALSFPAPYRHANV